MRRLLMQITERFYNRGDFSYINFSDRLFRFESFATVHKSFMLELIFSPAPGSFCSSDTFAATILLPDDTFDHHSKAFATLLLICCNAFTATLTFRRGIFSGQAAFGAVYTNGTCWYIRRLLLSAQFSF